MFKEKENCRIRRISAKVSPKETLLAKKYLQGAVHSFCKNNPGEAFALRDLVGGENRDWNGTPLQALYAYHISTGKSDPDAKQRAAVDAGWLLKAALAEDTSRYFAQSKGGRTKLYCKID